MTRSIQVSTGSLGFLCIFSLASSVWAQDPASGDGSEAVPRESTKAAAPSEQPNAQKAAQGSDATESEPSDTSSDATDSAAGVADTRTEAPEPVEPATAPSAQQPQSSPAQPEQAGPAADLAPAPAPPRKGRIHDSFYLRMTAGPTLNHYDFSDGPPGTGAITETGGGLGLRIGGTPTTGLVVGGGLWLGGADTDEWRGENSERGSVGVVAIGPFVDYFPDPDRGFHFGGTLGFGAMGLNIDGIADEARAAGGGTFGAWVGYDFWLGPEWSLGVEFNYLGLRSHNDEHDWKGTADIVGISVTGLYH